MNFKISKFRYFNLFVIILFILNFWGCEFPNTPGKPESNYSLLFNLTANGENQNIYIYRIADNNGDIDNNNLGKYFIKTAKISLSNPVLNYSNFIIKELSLDPFNSKGFYYTNSDSLKIFSSTQYFININIDSYIVKGMVTTPDDFNILTPLPNSTINANNNTNISWTSSYTAKGYIINIANTDTISYNDSLYIRTFKNSYITQDTSFFLSPNFIYRGSLKIDILAFDKNYYNHIIKNIPSSGIEGAYGYFGASVLKSVTVNVK